MTHSGSPEDLVPQQKLGKRFKLVRRLWSDHQSHVFEVFDRSKDRTLALRLLAWTEDQRVRAVSARLESAHVARCALAPLAFCWPQSPAPALD